MKYCYFFSVFHREKLDATEFIDHPLVLSDYGDYDDYNDADDYDVHDNYENYDNHNIPK